MNKKLIRLTEQDLHRIVKESVNRILRETIEEGQGWNLFKKTVDQVNKGDLDYDMQKEMDADPRSKKFKSNYIKYGNDFGYDANMDAYDNNGAPQPTPYADKEFHGDDALPRINHSLRGKIGRAAGLGAANAYIYGRGMVDKIRKR